MKLAPWRPIALTYWLVLPAPAVFAVGVAEFVLGCLVLSFSSWRPIRWATHAAYGAYIVTLALQLWAGESVCECLGSRSLPIIWMIALDALLLASMWWLRESWQRPLLRTRSGNTKPFVEILSATRYALPFVILGNTILFGSTDSAVSYATGARLLANSSTHYVGRLQAEQFGSATFQIRNYSNQSIRILGAKASCRCVALDDLPITLTPGTSGDLHIRMKARRGGLPQLQREMATLITDDPARSLTLTVTAGVMSPR